MNISSTSSIGKRFLLGIMYFVYLIECADGSMYTGITRNVARRFKEHQTKLGGNYTRSRGVLRVLYTEEHPNRSSASKREAEIKRWPRAKKLELVERGGDKTGASS